MDFSILQWKFYIAYDIYYFIVLNKPYDSYYGHITGLHCMSGNYICRALKTSFPCISIIF